MTCDPIKYIEPDLFDLRITLDHPENVEYVTIRVGVSTDSDPEPAYHHFNFAVPK